MHGPPSLTATLKDPKSDREMHRQIAQAVFSPDRADSSIKYSMKAGLLNRVHAGLVTAALTVTHDHRVPELNCIMVSYRTKDLLLAFS